MIKNYYYYLNILLNQIYIIKKIIFNHISFNLKKMNIFVIIIYRISQIMYSLVKISINLPF